MMTLITLALISLSVLLCGFSYYLLGEKRTLQEGELTQRGHLDASMARCVALEDALTNTYTELQDTTRRLAATTARASVTHSDRIESLLYDRDLTRGDV